jgi:hypothetical protein
MSADEGETATHQHTKPCQDCPFARSALRGWLGSMSVEEWLRCAHGVTKVDCHVHLTKECAGLAIYRANCAKLPMPGQLRLPKDRKRCFSSPVEFTAHHTRT